MSFSKQKNMLDDSMLTPRHVAGFLGIPLATLYQWRTKGTAPRAVKVGRHLRFRRADLEAWLDQHADVNRGGAA